MWSKALRTGGSYGSTGRYLAQGEIYVYTQNKDDAPRRTRGGMTTHILLQEGDVAGTALTATWVDVQPGAAQRLHHHEPEQIYVVVRGSGRMHIGEETRELTAGQLAHVPSNVPHGIVNTSEGVLSYVSVATPTFSQETFYDEGNI